MNIASEFPETGISLSIVAFRTPLEQLKYAVESAFIALQAAGLEAESNIIVVDNGDGSECAQEQLWPLAERLEDAGCGLDFVRGHGNIGYGAAHNLAFGQGHRPLHVFMNADVELDSQVFVQGSAYFKANADVAMISPVAHNCLGDRQFLCKRYPAVFDLFLRGFGPVFLKKYFSQRLAQYEMRELNSARRASKDVRIISGCFMFCRSDIIRQVGGFDTAFFLYFEDFDLSLRVGQHAKLAYVPSMKIRHDGGNSARKGAAHIVMFMRSAYRFFSLHGWRWI
jgi:GT2 family glycosyltransferase